MPTEVCVIDTPCMNRMKNTLGWALLMASLPSVTGCAALLGETVTPEQIALEVVVVGDGSGRDACSLNAHEVGAATHLVSVIAEHGPAHVRILDHADAVVFEADSVGTSEGSSGEGSESQPASLAEGP